MNDILGLVIGFILSVGNGMFVASEFSLVNLDRRELEARRARGDKGLDTIINALKITSTHLSSAQLGITLTTLVTGYTFQPAVSNLVQRPLLALGMSEIAVQGVGGIIGILLATLISMVVGELIPKNYALALPLATAKVAVPFQVVFTRIFLPVIRFFNDTANKAVRMFGIEPKEELSGARSAAELSSMVRHSAVSGVLDLDQAVLLQRTLHFSNHRAVEVMVPRPQVHFLSAANTVADLIEKTRESGHSRFPVYEGTIDTVVGLAHFRDAFAISEDDWDSTTVGEIMSDVTYVPEAAGVDNLLQTLRTNGHQFAIVIDEHGGTTGIVTLEDLAEEIVGELYDEHDRAEAAVTRLPDRLIIEAGLRPDELESITGLKVPDDGTYETIAGFVVSEVGRVPAVGDIVNLETGELHVTEMDGTAVATIEYIPDDPDNDPALLSLEERIDRLRSGEEDDE